MGLNAGTLLPVFTLSGTWGSKVHLTDEEILTLIGDFSAPAQEYFAKEDVIVELKHLSNKHNVIFSIFEKKPVIIIAQRPLKQPDDVLQKVKGVYLGKASWDRLMNMATTIRTLAKPYNMFTFSECAPAWLRDFAQCIANAGGYFSPYPPPMSPEEDIILERFYNDTCFQATWRDIIADYMAKKRDSNEIRFIREMCAKSPIVVKEELLKVRNLPHVYMKLSYHNDHV